MGMLKQLYVKDFRPQREAQLEFGSGVNVIIGEPDAGKSTLLQAIRWIATNRPLGDSFIRRGGAKEARAQMVFQEDDESLLAITRVRSATENTYHITSPTQDMELLAGSTPPSEVLDALNLSDINYQDQMDSYFLVFESSGAVASYIRSVTGLEDVKVVLDKISSKLNKAQTLLNGQKEDLKVLDSKLTELNRFDAKRFAELLELAEAEETRRTSISCQSTLLRSVIDQLREVQRSKIDLPEERIAELRQQVQVDTREKQDVSSKLTTLYAVVSGLRGVKLSKIYLPNDLDARYAKCAQVQNEFVNSGHQITHLENLIADIRRSQESRIYLPNDLDARFAARQEVQEQYVLVTSKILDLSDLRVDIAALLMEQVANQNEIDECARDIAALKEQLVECPSCGSILTEETKAVLLGEDSL